MDIYDRNLKYFVGNSHMIYMNGESDKFTNLVHAFNMFLMNYWTDYFANAGWAQDNFLADDIKETQKALIGLVNSSEDSINIAMLSFMEGLKPAPEMFARRGHNQYKQAMTYYDDLNSEYGYDPISVFRKIMELLKIESIQAIARAEFKAAGLPYILIQNSGD